MRGKKRSTSREGALERDYNICYKAISQAMVIYFEDYKPQSYAFLQASKIKFEKWLRDIADKYGITDPYIPEEALVREIREELDTEIRIGDFLIRVEYDYPKFHLSMECYWATIKEGHLELLEHQAAKWLDLLDLRQVKWLPADILVIDEIERTLNN